MLASGATSWGAWDVPAAKLSPPGPPPPGTGLLHLLTFNGATAFRRWKRPVPRCPFAAPLLPVCCPFNGATAFRRWKRPVPRCPFAAPLLPLCCPFNGATAFRRWKRRSPGPCFNGAVSRPVVNQQCPLQWGHRLSAMETTCRLTSLSARSTIVTLSRFNGATAFRRWKQGGVPRRGPVYQPLQWGHRLSAMEMTIVPG